MKNVKIDNELKGQGFNSCQKTGTGKIIINPVNMTEEIAKEFYRELLEFQKRFCNKQKRRG
jgi:hypothetical protein